jgi:CDP-diacylglycerol---serine O-phosphatidyltransferase
MTPAEGAPAAERRGLRRGVFLLPSLFTLANLFCGWACVVYAMHGQFHTAAPFIGVAIVLDMLDGRIARMTGSSSAFGVEFDSLADLISFGMAPAALTFQWGLAPLGRLGWAIGFIYLAAAAVRLARFNIQRVADKRYFVGLPSPGAAGLVLASVFAFDGDFDGWHRWGPVVLAIVPAALMASSFRFTSFRWLASPRRDRIWVTVLVVVLALVGFATVPAATGLVIAYGYVALCPLGWATAPLRRRWFGADAVAPTRHHIPSVFFLVDDADG